MLAGCGGDGEPATSPAEPEPSTRTTPSRDAPRIREARCPAAAVNCESATGRILVVEAKDPDGDGDAHFVVASPRSITAPGIAVIDVRRELRPHPLPAPGDLLSASGPVYRGSYGQRQIQADVVRVAGVNAR